MSRFKIFAFAGAFLLVLLVIVFLPKKGKEAKPPVQNIEAVAELPSEPQIENSAAKPKQLTPISSDADLPKEANQLAKLFNPYPPILPIVETITYQPRTSWLSGRQAYLGDYASHFKTSKHFISRSLHGAGNYFSETIRLGDKFNVFKIDRPIEFHLVLDLSRLKIWLYAYDEEEDTRYYLSSYPVAAGRISQSSPSGSLTPLGVYSLGKDITIYKEGMQGMWRKEPIEMITVFGMRWIGFDKEIAGCTASSKGLGLHGAPWYRTEDGKLIECRDCIGNYVSSGCIRLLSEDIEELYSLLSSRPAYIHIVRDFTEAYLPGSKNV